MILIKLLNGKDLDGGVEFIQGCKEFQQRDSYQVNYFLLIDVDIDPINYIDNPEFNINSYGLGKTTFSD